MNSRKLLITVTATALLLAFGTQVQARWWKATYMNELWQEHVLQARFVSGELTCPSDGVRGEVRYTIEVNSTAKAPPWSKITKRWPFDSFVSLPFGPRGFRTDSTRRHEAAWNNRGVVAGWPVEDSISFLRERCNVTPTGERQWVRARGSGTPDELYFNADGSITVQATVETLSEKEWADGTVFVAPIGDPYTITLTLDPGVEAGFDNLSIQRSGSGEDSWSGTHLTGTSNEQVTGEAIVCLGQNTKCPTIVADPNLTTQQESLRTDYAVSKQ